MIWHATEPVVYSASADATIRVWDARSGECLQTFHGHTSVILDMAISRYDAAGRPMHHRGHGLTRVGSGGRGGDDMAGAAMAGPSSRVPTTGSVCSGYI